MDGREEHIKHIHGLSYEEMLKLHRSGVVDHMYLTGELGEFFYAAMESEKAKLSHDEKIAVSKKVGFAKPRNQFGETNA